MNRVLSVDLLRGFSLVCMVLIHFIIYWGNEAAMHTWLYFTFNDLLADWGAAGFLMMMGISQVLSAAKTPNAAELVLFKKSFDGLDLAGIVLPRRVANDLANELFVA